MMARLSRRRAFASRIRKREYLSLFQPSFRGKKIRTSLMSRMRFRMLRKFYPSQKLRTPTSNISTNQIMIPSLAAPRSLSTSFSRDPYPNSNRLTPFFSLSSLRSPS
jgi:hypothetical protein